MPNTKKHIWAQIFMISLFILGGAFVINAEHAEAKTIKVFQGEAPNLTNPKKPYSPEKQCELSKKAAATAAEMSAWADQTASENHLERVAWSRGAYRCQGSCEPYIEMDEWKNLNSGASSDELESTQPYYCTDWAGPGGADINDSSILKFFN